MRGCVKALYHTVDLDDSLEGIERRLSIVPKQIVAWDYLV
jgi:hypothetical protein